MDNIFRLPYCRLIQMRHNEPNKVIGDTRLPLTESVYGQEEILGLQSVTIKYGMGFITCDVSFPIHQDMIQASQDLNDYSEMHKIFSLKNKWTLEFGWSSDLTSGFKIADMLLKDWTLDYDASLRSFIAKFKLIPSHSFILRDIKLLMLAGVVETLKNEISKFNDNKDSDNDYSGGHPLSIGNIITTVLEGCKTVISDNNLTPFEVGFIEASKDREDHLKEISAPIGRISITKGRPEPGYPGGYAAQESVSVVQTSLDDAKAIADEKRKAYPSNVFEYATPDDIPNPEEIRLLLFGKNDDILDSRSKAFNSEPADAKTLINITNDSYKDLNVHQFITTLLRDNGFTWMPTFAAINNDGKLQWMILQSDFNNIGISTLEQEYIGIHSVNKGSTKGADKQFRFLNTFGKPSSKTSTLFDLHSNRNVVLSINATTDPGRSTIGTAYAAEQLATNQSNIPIGKVMEAYRSEIFVYLAQQSKELNIETIGFPEIKIGDNIYVNLGGTLYSGKYKIIEMEHTIGDSFTTNIRAIRTKTGIDGKPASDEQDGKTELTEMEIDKVAFTPSEKQYARTRGVALNQNQALWEK